MINPERLLPPRFLSNEERERERDKCFYMNMEFIHPVQHKRLNGDERQRKREREGKSNYSENCNPYVETQNICQTYGRVKDDVIRTYHP